MLEQRNLKLDLAALGGLALSLFLAVALFTYDRADPPANLVYPPSGETQNACGWFGAWIAHTLFSSLGLGAFYVLVSLAVLDAALLRHRPVTDRGLRAIGWTLSLAGLTTLAAMALPRLGPGPAIGAGRLLRRAGARIAGDALCQRRRLHSGYQPGVGWLAALHRLRIAATDRLYGGRAGQASAARRCALAAPWGSGGVAWRQATLKRA